MANGQVWQRPMYYGGRTPERFIDDKVHLYMHVWQHEEALDGC